TPGCTNEAKDFTELAGEFAALGVPVVGVSKDKPARLKKFSDKYGLAVTLASDEPGAACEAFGTWVEKSLYGRKYMGIARATFLVNATGTIVRAWPQVKVKGHAEEVLGEAKRL
ncbi:MAG: peroxiredoxin, partial [Sphingobium sp.]